MDTRLVFLVIVHFGALRDSRLTTQDKEKANYLFFLRFPSHEEAANQPRRGGTSFAFGAPPSRVTEHNHFPPLRRLLLGDTPEINHHNHMKNIFNGFFFQI
jgi:hypothetical protein